MSARRAPYRKSYGLEGLVFDGVWFSAGFPEETASFRPSTQAAVRFSIADV